MYQAESSLGIPDARIDQPVEQINQQIDSHYSGPDEQRASLQNRVIATIDGLDQPFADARPRKNRLGKNCPGEENADLEADDCHDWDQCIAQRVHGDDPPSRKTLGASCADIILAEHLE